MRRRRAWPHRILIVLVLAGLAALGGAMAGDVQAQSTLDAAREALRTGDYEDAIERFGDLVDGRDADPAAAEGLVSALAMVGRYDEAEAAARRFIERSSRSSELWTELGEVLYRTGRRDAAERAFRRALEGGAADSLTARLNLAIARYERGERDAAMREFDRFIDVYNRTRQLRSEQLVAVARAVTYLGVRNPQLFKDAVRAYDEAIAADPGDLEARVRLGELFLEKYNSGDAGAEFAEALKVNGSHPRALLGMARRMHFDREGEAIGMVRRSLEVNPGLVPARVFLARLYIESEDYARAEGELERALGTNPASLEALATLAAARYLAGDRAGYREAVRRALELNPVYADLYVTLGELAARNRMYHRAVEFGRRATELDPRSWRGHAVLGINLLRVREIDAGREALETAFEGDPYDVWTVNTLDLMDTVEEEYREIRTDRFRIWVHGDEAELLALYLGDLAERAYDRLARKYDHAPETPIRLEVFRRHADFSVRTIGLVGLGALGVSFGPVIAMDAPSARDAGHFNWGSTLWHEIAHTFHLSATDHQVPRWFSEGLAVYEERTARRGWGDDVTPGFLAAHKQGRTLPIAELNEGFMRPRYPEQIAHSYYQASLVFDFIARTRGESAILDMLRAYGAGKRTSEVFGEVLGMELEEFDRAFTADLEERFAAGLSSLRTEGPMSGSLPGGADPAVRARTRPDDYVAQLVYGRRLLDDGKTAEAIERLRRAKRLFPEYVGPDSPHGFLARAYLETGDTTAAIAELVELTAVDERSYGAHLRLAELREVRGEVRGAAEALERAVYIYPYEADLHRRLAGLYRRLGEHGDAIRERRAVIALDPVDRAAALYDLAVAYYEAGDLGSARRAVLQALEVAPNYADAQELLLRIHDRSNGSSP